MTVHDFLRYHTNVGDVVVFTDCGWQIGCTYIDHEDLFVRSLDGQLLSSQVANLKVERRPWAVNPVIVVEISKGE